MVNNMIWIDSTDLKNWADRRDCEETLPLLIRRLIRATVNRIKFISFPAEESIVCPGWDGRLESCEETEYIPMGSSVWEIGKNKDIKTKANKDYQKRKQDPRYINPSETVYIFVTPRIWTNKDKWVDDKKKDNFWKDVRVYDARDLEEWLEQAPAVGAWLARNSDIGKYPENVLPLEDWWKEWSQSTSPHLIPELLLGGRKIEKEKVINWLKSASSYLIVQSSTKEEVIGFLASIILSLPGEEKEYFFSRALVVKDENSFRHTVTTCKQGLILIPVFEDTDFTISYSNNHHIFIPLNPDNNATKEKIVLPHIDREEFISNLEKMGIQREQAERLSKDTVRNICILIRQLHPSSQPRWVKSGRVSDLLPALLIGKWDENKQGDKDVVSKIAKKPYDEFIRILKGYLYIEDPPILKIGNLWRLISPLDAFVYLSPFLINADFEDFKNVSLEVLKEIDPSLDLEPEKRYMAFVYGKIPKYSKELREGIAQTLVLIAVFGDTVNSGNSLDLPYNVTSQNLVDYVIYELLNNADWKLWCSLSDVLPLIAEASPSSFLDTVEDSLSQTPPPIMRMFFSETEDSLTSHSVHPSLLWALECLAWSPELLGRVLLILSKLSKLDPGGKIANRPINSLRNIFLPWAPQTFANLGQRLECLDLLIEKDYEIGWNLLIDLLLHSDEVCFPNYKTRWRQFSEKIENKVTNKEYSESIIEILDRVLKNAGNNGRRWCEIMEYFDNIPFKEERRKVLCKLSEVINSIDEGRFELWNKLREILSRHCSFPDTKWALSEEELKEIEKLYNRLEPDDIIKRFQWLFDDDPKLLEGKEMEDYEKLKEIISQKRERAIQSIKEKLGINGIIKLSSHTKNPRLVGITLAEFSLTDKEERVLFSLLDSTEQNKILFVQDYILQKSLKNGEVYIERIVNDALSENWSSEKIINLFLALPQDRKVWEILKNFNLQIQQKYWGKVYPKLRELSTDDKIYVLEQLMEVKRYFTALDTIFMFKNEVSPKFIAELLKKSALEKSIDAPSAIFSYTIKELFKILDQSEEVRKDEIALLEWLYLSILASTGSSRPPKMLHQELSENSEFFAEVIKYLYKPKNKNVEEEEKELPEELKRQRAYLAWQLLQSWKTVPGSDSNGKIDYDKLKAWVNKSRELCKKMNRLEVCDSHIGQVLAYAIPDENGNWPPEEVCKIIDEMMSKELDEGFRIGVRSKRGVVVKSPFEGGKQERNLAEQYKKYSEKWENHYPKTSDILRKISDIYKNKAKREDEESEKMNLE
jgi:hypothetical protein